MSVAIEPSILFPDGMRIFSRSVSFVQVPAATPLVVNVGIAGAATPYTYTAQTAANAQVMASQVNAAVSQPSASAVSLSDPPPVGTSPFTSITPNTATVGVIYNGAIAGLGFLSLAISDMQADDGAGHVIGALSVGVASDTQITVTFANYSPGGVPAFTALTPAGTYTLYYTTDGIHWVTTGLTVVAS